jgi:nucleolar protein 12
MSLLDIFSNAGVEKFQRIAKPEPLEDSFPTKSQRPAEAPQYATTSKRNKRKRVKEEASVVVESIVEQDDANDDHQSGDDELTVFVGNLSIEESVKSIKNIFADCGEIASVRIRSVPIKGTAIDENGNQNLVKKVCVNSKLLGTQKGSFNAYVVFKKKESVSLALALDNEVVNGRHIRVDGVKPRIFDPKRSVFLGNLPHYADEEEIRNHFAASLSNGHDDIEGIRIIRDPETLVGKGIGYLLLKDIDAVSAALRLNEVRFFIKLLAFIYMPNL